MCTQQANETTRVIEFPDANGMTQRLRVLQESVSGLYFAVDESYLEQEVDLLHSPYGNGTFTSEESAS